MTANQTTAFPTPDPAEVQALIDSEQRLRLVIDTMPGLVWSSLPDGHIDYLNKRWLDYTGLTLEQASGWGWQHAIHPLDIAGLLEYWASILTAGTAGEYEARLRRHDGAYRWFLFRGVPLYSESGVVVKWYGTNTDIEDRKQAEEKLRVSEKSLAEGQRLTKTGTWVLDFKTGSTDWSVETCRIFGFPDPPPSPHYSEFRARVYSEDREAVDRGLRESFETGEPRPLGYRFLLPDGTLKFIETISEPVKDETGKVLKLMGTIMDVTERRQAEDALQSSEILARGQLNALTRTLEALVAEPEPDRFLEHVLRTITEQLDAHSSSIWRKDLSTGQMKFECAFEGGRMVSDSTVNGATSDPLQPLPGASFPRGVVLTERASVIDDIRDAPVSPWRDHLISQGVVTVLLVPTAIAGRVEGVISIRFSHRRMFCTGELELAQALANQAMLALQLMLLTRESRQAAVMAERNRMARDIHDTLAQGFTGVIMQLQAAKGAAALGTMTDAAAHIERAEELARSSLGEARNSVRALRPQSLRDGNLCRAMEDLLKRVAGDANLTSEFHVQGEPRMMPLEWEEDLLRIAQESLTNTIKHARATTFRATLAFGEKQTHLHLADDGHGFDPLHEHDGLGLIGMQERVQRMGGNFILRSQPDQSTEITVILNHPMPLNAHHA
ncbi:MAG: PAS domain-containing protein [Luteolibacter sp.]